MSFDPKIPLTPYVPSPPPLLEGQEKLYLNRELDNIRRALDQSNRAIEEIREYLKTLP